MFVKMSLLVGGDNRSRDWITTTSFVRTRIALYSILILLSCCPSMPYQGAATLLIRAKVEVKDKQLPNLTLQESITFNVLDTYLVILL